MAKKHPTPPNWLIGILTVLICIAAVGGALFGVSLTAEASEEGFLPHSAEYQHDSYEHNPIPSNAALSFDAHIICWQVDKSAKVNAGKMQCSLISKSDTFRFTNLTEKVAQHNESVDAANRPTQLGM